jgi:hypothetical protein
MGSNFNQSPVWFWKSTGTSCIPVVQTDSLVKLQVESSSIVLVYFLSAVSFTSFTLTDIPPSPLRHKSDCPLVFTLPKSISFSSRFLYLAWLLQSVCPSLPTYVRYRFIKGKIHRGMNYHSKCNLTRKLQTQTSLSSAFYLADFMYETVLSTATLP